MDEYPGQPGQPPAPQTPPPPADVPPAPQPQYAPPAAPPQYAPPAAPQYAPQQPAPAKKKTWIWIVLAIVVLGLIGCCAIAVFGGKAFFDFASGPKDSIEAMNQAALDGDQAEFEKYFDANAIAENSYDDVVEYFKTQEDYQSLVDQLGQEEADRILSEEYLTEEDWVSEIADSMKLSGDGEQDEPFPNYTIDKTNIENDTAELTVTADTESGTTQFVLGFVNEDYKGETVWRLKEIKNFVDLMNEQGELSSE